MTDNNKKFLDYMNKTNDIAKTYGFNNGLDWATTARNEGLLSLSEHSDFSKCYGLGLSICGGNARDIRVTDKTLKAAKNFNDRIKVSRLRKQKEPDIFGESRERIETLRTGCGPDDIVAKLKREMKMEQLAQNRQYFRTASPPDKVRLIQEYGAGYRLEEKLREVKKKPDSVKNRVIDEVLAECMAPGLTKEEVAEFLDSL